ncbi:TetR/AcrR family transcriptional regulator [Streptomyces sp. MUM 136J]|uniref:TetR/AcrR family transcriptional regulator n=1 Tax=Streptomyces sp. MUM 136J TaxID=2791992 RepID=UPI001F03ADD5|nr:TetR/AcrR family transcriptional regulator [Streptomyces sp. MUM 136J]MCH0572979.1 TetR/AcrR family transcriptional regulator [Streptomyces sp. MUM 136J]
MGQVTQSRRMRLREATTAEIKATALKHMASSGTAAISLRAIARDMGMTAGAIYSYFDTRDNLVSVLIADVYGNLASALETAIADCPQDDAATQVQAFGRAYRNWAVGNPEEFRLVYGDAVPDYQPPAGGAAAEAEHRACAVLTGIVAAAWPKAQHLYIGSDHVWSDFDPEFAELIRQSFPDLPPAAVALSLRVWGRMHGLVSLEVYGHLGPQVRDPEKLYRAELVDLSRSLGHVSVGESPDAVPA